MAKIVINISDEEYEDYKTLTDYGYGTMFNSLVERIANGVVLPKGHGRLIDADALQRTYCEDNCGARKCTDAMDRCVFIGAVLETPTVIEADKEVENV